MEFSAAVSALAADTYLDGCAGGVFPLSFFLLNTQRLIAPR